MDFERRTGPSRLEHLRILDFTQVLSGPFASMLLADAGADVVKVERPPSGDLTRQWGPPFIHGESLYFAAFNRGKQSVVADLANADDVMLVHKLARKADILLENLRPGTLTKFGLGYEDLKADMPGLIYVSICGYREQSARYEDPALEVVLEGESGLMAITGTGQPPVRQGVAVIDMMTGVLAVSKMMEALYTRERTGRGQRVVLSLQETAQLLMTHPYLVHTAGNTAYPAGGTTHPSIAPYEHFKTRDTPIIVGAVNDSQFARLSQLLEHPEWTLGMWSSNARRVSDRAVLHRTLESIFVTRPGTEWVDLLRASKLVVGLVRPLDIAADAWRTDGLPKIVSRDNRYGDLAYPSSPWLDGGEVRAAPILGDDKARVMEHWLGEKIENGVED